MDTDFTPIIENQIKLIAKVQNLALVDLTEKNSEMVETHLNLLFELYSISEIFYEDDDEDDDEDDSEVDKTPAPLPRDAKY